MPQRKHVVYRLNVSPEEHRALLIERIKTLDDATALNALQDRVPVPWRSGWTCTLKILSRDSDGSLKALITANGPGLRIPYVRKVRLCSKHSLRLGKG